MIIFFNDLVELKDKNLFTVILCVLVFAGTELIFLIVAGIESIIEPHRLEGTLKDQLV